MKKEYLVFHLCAEPHRITVGCRVGNSCVAVSRLGLDLINCNAKSH